MYSTVEALLDQANRSFRQIKVALFKDMMDLLEESGVEWEDFPLGNKCPICNSLLGKYLETNENICVNEKCEFYDHVVK